MSYVRLVAVTSLAVGFTGSAALADLTADQVWQGWTGYLDDVGYTVTSDTSRSGDTLTIRNLALEMVPSDADGSLSMRLGEVRLVENGDGSVSVVLPDTLPIAIAATDDEAQQVTASVEIAQDNLDVNVSGTPEDMAYRFSADALVLALTALQAGDETPDIRAARIRLEDMTGNSRSVPQDKSHAMRQELRAGPVTYEVDVTEPEDGGTMALSGSMEQIEFTSDATVPDSFASDDIAGALRDGFRFDSRIEYETGTSTYRIAEGDNVIEGTRSSARGRLGTSMGPDGLRYGGAGEDVTVALDASDIPFPVDLSMARMALDVTMPVVESEVMQDYGVDLELAKFTMSDQIWSMIDPGARLPRDPATLRIDLSGTGRLSFDLLDPEEVERLDNRDTAPGEVESLTLNELTLDVAGASLSGAGAFTFDATDLESFGGAPAPEGTLDLRLVGGNALLDRLIDMGLVPQQQADGVRMMMGLFARPGDAEDELLSTIEVTDDGRILANGQRLK